MRFCEDRPGGTVDRTRALRRNAAEPERHLLHGLRETFPHLKWHYQTPIGPYYADILCFSERLVIEVDGDTHAMAADYDADRSAFIARGGYHVTRVANADVTQNLDGVIEQISFSLREKEGTRCVSSGKDEGDRTQEKGGTA